MLSRLSEDLRKPLYTEFWLRLLITLLAVGGATVHALSPKIPDLVSGGLLALGIVPWLSPLLKSVEVTGIGKLEFRVDEVKAQQDLLREQVDGLRFLVSGFVTEKELMTLTKLERDGPFEYKRGLGQEDRFTGELRRLKDLGLIIKRGSGFLADLPESGDLKSFMEITDRGRTYLKLRRSVLDSTN